MRCFIPAFAAVLFAGVAGAALAQDAPPSPDQPTSVMKAEDMSLTCPAIGEEAAQLSQDMGGAPEGGFIRSVGSVARSGVAMLVPGAGLAMAGADALTRGDRERKEAEARGLAYRWYYLNGLSAGRNCQGQAEAATPAVESTTPQQAPQLPSTVPVVPAG